MKSEMRDCETCQEYQSRISTYEQILAEVTKPEKEAVLNKEIEQNQAMYGIHRVVDHKDERYRGNLRKNFEIMLRYFVSHSDILDKVLD